jgi:hypothetical protein
MKLRLSDPFVIDAYQKQITCIGSEVNDHTLFERIKEACLKKRAFLFVSEDGFVVLAPDVDQGVLIWAAHSIRATNRLRYLQEIERLALDIGVNQVIFWSNRKGFHKIAPPFGFSATPSIWMGTPITLWMKKI